MVRSHIVALVTLAGGGIASAAIYTPSPIDPSGIRDLSGRIVSVPFVNRAVPNTNFNVYTGVATSAGGLALLESSTTPARDDVVTLGTANEQINDYVAAAASVQRFVTSSTSVDQFGFDVITIAISGRTATGAPADLWPSGFSSGGNALTSGGVGLGLSLPASVGGSVPMSIAPVNYVNRLSIEIISDGASSGEIVLPSTFYGGGPGGAWNGIVGVSFANGATGTDVDSDIIFRITVVPAPGAAGLAGIAGLIAMRRRRR